MTAPCTECTPDEYDDIGMCRHGYSLSEAEEDGWVPPGVPAPEGGPGDWDGDREQWAALGDKRVAGAGGRDRRDVAALEAVIRGPNPDGGDLPGYVSTPEAARLAGITYGRLAYWVSKGWVRGVAGPGGRMLWGPAERLNVHVMRALCRAGLLPSVAGSILADRDMAMAWYDVSPLEAIWMGLAPGVDIHIHLEEL